MIPTSSAHSWVLGFLAVPLLLALWWRGRRARVAFPFDHRGPSRSRSWRLVLGITQLAPLVMLALAIVVVAGPQVLQRPQDKRKLTNIQILLDVSGSMGYDTPPRYTNAVAAIDELTRSRDGDAMGLIFFGNEQIQWVPITTDLQAIRNALPYADPERQPDQMGGTRIAAALQFTTQIMETEAQAGGDRVIILVSDGDSQDIASGDQYALADMLKEAGIKLFYLHISREAPAVPEVVELASLTGGRGFVARDRDGTLEVFRQVDRMTKAEFEQLATQRVDGYGLVAALLLLASAVHLVGLLGLRYTPW